MKAPDAAEALVVHAMRHGWSTYALWGSERTAVADQVFYTVTCLAPPTRDRPSREVKAVWDVDGTEFTSRLRECRTREPQQVNMREASLRAAREVIAAHPC